MQQQATLIFITKLYVKYLVPAKVTIMVADLLKYIATLAVHSELPTAYTLAVVNICWVFADVGVHGSARWPKQELRNPRINVVIVGHETHQQKESS